MRIGIDVSQIAYSGGVANYLSQLVEEMVKLDKTSEFVLFFSSLRRGNALLDFKEKLSSRNVIIKDYSFPPSLLDFIWNKLHIMPIENFIGDVDIFISSDWTQPPTKRAKSATILYDFIVYKYPEETHDMTKVQMRNLRVVPNIVKTQKRRLEWVKKECDVMFCISEATKKDAIDILKIDAEKLKVVYPGMTL